MDSKKNPVSDAVQRLLNTSVQDMQSGLWSWRDVTILEAVIAVAKKRKEKTKVTILERHVRKLMNVDKTVIEEELLVPSSKLESVNAHYCADKLNMHDYSKSKGIVFEFQRKLWICTGGCGMAKRLAWVEIYEVVPTENYKGALPYLRDGKPVHIGGGHWYYTGGQFTYDGRSYTITNHSMKLMPDNQSEPEQLNLFSTKKNALAK